jgi:hypothetical protein
LGNSPSKGESSEKTPPLAKKIPFLLGSNIRISTVPFSPLFAPVTSLLLVRGHPILIWSNQSDPRKSSVPCRVQLDVLQILWFLANPFVAHDIGESVIISNFLEH